MSTSTAATSTTPRATGTASLPVSSRTAVLEATTKALVNEASQTAGDNELESEKKNSDNHRGVASTAGLGVGLGIGVPLTAGAVGYLGFMIWRRRKSRGERNDSPVSDHYKLSPLQAKPPVELEAPGAIPVVQELSPEGGIAELQG